MRARDAVSRRQCRHAHFAARMRAPLLIMTRSASGLLPPQIQA